MRSQNETRRIGGAVLVLACVLSLGAAAGRPSPGGSQAAAGPGSLDLILKDLAGYDGGIESAALWKLRDFVVSVKDDPAARASCEAKLVAYLGSRATPSAKLAAARWLRVIAGEGSIPALIPLVLKKDTTDYARYVLESIPGGAAGRPLIEALSASRGEIRLGIVSTLGKRGAADAVPALARLMAVADPATASAAANALGLIGGPSAADSLRAEIGRSRPATKEAAATALLACAGRFLAAGDAAASLRACEAVLAAGVSTAAGAAAVRGKIASLGEKAPAFVLETLKDPARERREAAVGTIAKVFPGREIAPVCAALPGLEEGTRAQVLAVLAGYPKEAVLPAILESAKSGTGASRLAALRALEKTGDETVVPFLAETAAHASGAEASAARTSLSGLKGRPVDEAVISLLDKDPAPDIAAELVQAAGERKIFAAKPRLAALAAGPGGPVRRQALRGLRTIGTPSDIPGLLVLLVKAGDETEAAEIELTVGALARKVADPDRRADSVEAAYASAKEPAAKAALLRVMGGIGDCTSLALVRVALSDRDPAVLDAAVRAVAAWQNAAALDDAWEIARGASNPAHRLLGLRTCVRLIQLNKFRRPQAGAADLAKALAMATRPEEKKLVLGALPDFACPEALETATRLLADPDCSAEAKSAVDRIRKKLEPAG